MYELLKSRAYKVSAPLGGLRCPFCHVEEDGGYDYLLRHALMVAEGSSSNAKVRGNHFALAKYLVNDLHHCAKPPPSLIAARGNGEDDNETKEETSEMNTDQDKETRKEAAFDKLLKEKGDLESSYRNLLAREEKLP